MSRCLSLALLAALCASSVASAQMSPPAKVQPRPPSDAAKPATKPAAGAATPKITEQLAPAPARLWVIAPSARGQWLVRIDNEGDAPVMIVADVRLLRLDVRAWDEKAGAHAKQAEICDGGAAFGLEAEPPAGRELVLSKGESWVEAFDPRLICFGKQAQLLAPRSLIVPSYGFASRAVPASKEREPGPFAADAARAPRWYAPVKRLRGPTMLLSYAPPAVFPPTQRDAAPKSAEEASRHRRRPKRPPYRAPKDKLGAAMSLTTDRFAEGAAGRDVAFEVQAHNVGERPIFVALRARQVSLDVYAIDGEGYCPRVSADHWLPRDNFARLTPGKHIHVPVLPGEVCASDMFARPGLYAVVPTLHADDNGSEYGIVALTGRVSTRDPGKVGGTHEVDDDATLVRVKSGDRPFYLEPALAIPTKIAPTSPAPREESRDAG